MKEPKSILISGASSGIGAALALAYAKEGVQLLLLARNSERLENVAQQCINAGADAETSLVDVRDSVLMSEVILTFDRKSPIDLVIANAGISGGTGGQGVGSGESETQANDMFATNVIGVLNTIHPGLLKMKERRSGQIAIMSSLASFRGLPGAPAYSASKAAVRTYGEALRGELKKYNIDVNVICPGYIKTPMTDVNQFPMPGIMETKKAAHIIIDGLRKNKARIAFPYSLYFGIWFLGSLPPWLTDPLFRRLPEKS